MLLVNGYFPRATALTLSVLLLSAPAAHADASLCDTVRALAPMATDHFASLQMGSDDQPQIRLPGAAECSLEDGEYSCTWTGIKDPGKRAASLGKEVAACFVGASLESLDLLGMHIVKTETVTISILGALEDNLVLVTIK